MTREININDLFSETYAQAREKFKTTAANAGLACTSHVMTERGVEGEELAIDVVSSGARQPRQLLMIFSGSHGVEGFAGSAIQTGLMATQQLQNLPDDIAMVLVHALNPHGMSWSRRECEDGTDLAEFQYALASRKRHSTAEICFSIMLTETSSFSAIST